MFIKEFPEKAGRIYPPVISVEYGEVTIKDVEEGNKMDFEFSVSYIMEMREARKDIEVNSIKFAVFYTMTKDQQCRLQWECWVLLLSYVTSSGLSRDPLGLVFGHSWCISGSLGRILAVHLRIWKVSWLLFDASCLSWLACGVSWASPEAILDSSWAIPGASWVLSHTGCFLWGSGTLFGWILSFSGDFFDSSNSFALIASSAMWLAELHGLWRLLLREISASERDICFCER